MKTIAIVGTFDSKADEFNFLKSVIEKNGLETLMIDVGVFDSKIKADITNEDVATAAGESIRNIIDKKDRAFATSTLARGIKTLLPKLFKEGKFQGIISLGGSGGTSIATAGMREIPVGVPKVMVSTLAGGSNIESYVGTSDIVMFPSIVDVAGLNSISIEIFTNAANAICGMVKLIKDKDVKHKPHIAATMFGVTTPCINHAMKYLEDRGYEVLVFHATGTGGKTMESLIKQGFFDGVLDITTTELCDELVGGILSAGPNRLEAAGECRVPQIVSVGALDMVNYGPKNTVPKKYINRNLYEHNPSITLMRTNLEENKQLGKILAEKLNKAKGDTVLMLPLKGVSAIDDEGQPFYGPEENDVLFSTIKENINNNIELIEMDNNINDKEFAEKAAQKLIDLIEKNK